MNTKPEQLSEGMPGAHTGWDTEDQYERNLVMGHSYQPSAIQIETDRRKWNSCRTWKDAMQLNAQFFEGKLEVNINQSFKSRDLENTVLKTLLEHLYVFRHSLCHFDRGFTQDGEAFFARRSGSCCFMVPRDHELLAPLIYALMDSKQLHTVVLNPKTSNSDEHSLTNFCDHNSDVQKRQYGATLDSLDKVWLPFTTESCGEVRSELLDVWEGIRRFGCETIVSSYPLLFHVRARECETDVLMLLTIVLDKEIKRHSFDYLSQQYGFSEK